MVHVERLGAVGARDRVHALASGVQVPPVHRGEVVRRERSVGTDFINVKTGTGGIIEAEFLIQALQMRTDVWQPNWTAAVDRLVAGELTADEAAMLKSAYYLLRKCESVLRRYQNITVSTLPNDLAQLARLTRRMGFKAREEFDHDYASARTLIHRTYQQHIEQSSDRSKQRLLANSASGSGD